MTEQPSRELPASWLKSEISASKFDRVGSKQKIESSYRELTQESDKWGKRGTDEWNKNAMEAWMTKFNLSSEQQKTIREKLNTKSAVEEFQRKNNLNADGTIGGKTILAFAEVYDKDNLVNDDPFSGFDSLANKKITIDGQKIKEETVNAGRKLVEQLIGGREQKQGDIKNDPILALGKDSKIGTKNAGDMKISEIAGIDMNTLVDEDPKVTNQIMAVKSKFGKNFPSDLKDMTVAQYASYRENPLLAASKFTPNNKGELPIGFGEKGVKYMKGGKSSNGEKVDHITFMYRGDKAPTVVTYDQDRKPIEVALNKRFTKDGDYTLPDRSLLRVTRDTADGSRKWFVYGNKDDGKPKWALNEKGQLEEIKKAV